MAEKLFYSMGEVAEMFDVNASLLRHWETQFSVLRPKRNKKGNRLYTPADVENLKQIYHLVKERGMTLDGARKALKESRGIGDVPRDMELLERLQRIRAMLLEVRQELKAGEGEILAGESVAVSSENEPEECGEFVVPEEPVEASVAAVAGKPRRKAVVKIEEKAEAEKSGEEPHAEESGASGKKRPAARKPRRKKGEAENKELFAFYEQSLF